MAKVNDFGQKIGGARKDLWGTRGLMMEDIEDMTALEKKTYVKKDNIWPKYDTVAMVKEGQPRFVVYWKNEMRKLVFPDTKRMEDLAAYSPDLVEDVCTSYIHGVRKFMDLVNLVSTEEEIRDFYQKALQECFIKVSTHLFEYKGALRGVLKGNALLKACCSTGLYQMKRKMEKSGFGLTKEEIISEKYHIIHIDGKSGYWNASYDSKGKVCLAYKPGNSGTNFFYMDADAERTGEYALVSTVSHSILLVAGEEACLEKKKELIEKEVQEKGPVKQSAMKKKKWAPRHLEKLERSGPLHMHGADLTGDDFLSTFCIRAGEFGNYVGDKERQANMELCYDAFCDLADAIGIPYKGVSLPGLSLGSLAIAFGARGRGDAAAHYEPLREVINLTKIRGAGSLAHEWGHALDHFIGQKYGSAGFATEDTRSCVSSPVISALKKVKEAIYFNPDGTHTAYYRNSVAFDKLYTKTGHGYWDSICELFARAFAVYVESRLEAEGRRNDYLCGHARSAVTMDEKGTILKAYPEGEEKERINQAFDLLITSMVKEHLFPGREVAA